MTLVSRGGFLSLQLFGTCATGRQKSSIHYTQELSHPYLFSALVPMMMSDLIYKVRGQISTLERVMLKHLILRHLSEDTMMEIFDLAAADSNLEGIM